MFKVNNHRIEFHKIHTLIGIPSLKEEVARDITICKFFKNGSNTNENFESALSILNPLDIYDKVVGKKIALARTLAESDFTKVERREIWLAFWTWVASWSPERKMQVLEMFNGYEKEKTKKE